MTRNENDRIREALIALLKFGLEDGSAIAPGFNETKEQALTWLEKQGESILKTRTDNKLIEEVYSHLDSIKETADRMTSGNFMHNKAAIKFSANTIAKVLELIGIKEPEDYSSIDPYFGKPI